MDSTIISITWQNVGIAAVILCFLNKQSQGRHRQKDYGDMYARMVDTATRQSAKNIRHL